MESPLRPPNLHYNHARSRMFDKDLETLFLPLPATKEWGEDRGEGQTQNAPPLPDPLLHCMEEREWLRFARCVHRGTSVVFLVHSPGLGLWGRYEGKRAFSDATGSIDVSLTPQSPL